MKIINIDVKDEIVLKNIEDVDTGEITGISSKVIIPTGNYNNIILNFNFNNVKLCEDMNMFANFSIIGGASVDVALEKITVKDKVCQYACFIPAEVFEDECEFLLGLYGYSLNEDGSLKQRVSFTTVKNSVVQGTYDPDANEGIVPSPSVFEVYFNKITEAENKFNEFVDDVTGVPFCFDNVEAMKNSNTLIAGNYVKTAGYYEVNDGGSGLYRIRSKQESDVEDNGSVHFLANNLVAELIVDNCVNVKQFGAKGDGITDDTIAIQKSINYFHVGSDENNQNYATVLLKKYPNAGGIVSFPKATYLISSTIKIPCYVDIDFGYSTIKAKDGGAFINNYMFSVNSFNLNSWTYAYAGRKGFIKNGIIDGNNIDNIKGIYILDAHKIIDMEFSKMFNSICYSGGYYIDGIYIDRCNFINSRGEEYQIIKKCHGEHCYISNVAFDVTTNEETAANGIEVYSGHTGILQNITNGNIKMYDTEDFVISNWHCERGCFKSFGTNGTIIKNSNIYVRDNSTPITMDSGNFNNGLRSVIFENIKFIYYLILDEFNYDTKDIDLSVYSGHIFLKGCYRELWLKGKNSISQCGIVLFNGTKNILNPYNECEVYNKQIIPKSSTVRRDEYIFNGASLNNYLKWNLEIGTYYYKVINFADVEKLCGKVSDEKSIDITNNEQGTRLSISGNLGYGNTLRIYRGTSTGNYTHYVDIPNPKNCNMYDNGYSVNGFKWIETSEPIPTVNPIPQVERIDTYVSIFVKCKGYGNPSVGDWKKGDIIERVNPSTGGALMDICVESGTPGTWKQIKILDE